MISEILNSMPKDENLLLEIYNSTNTIQFMRNDFHMGI